MKDYLTMKEKFSLDYFESGEFTKMVIGVRLPTGATELIINTENIQEKFEYYLNAYDDWLRLKNNPQVQIVDYMFV
jgi:hypothetical protein